MPDPIAGSSPADILAQKLDLSIWLTLASWPALSIAVSNSWGGGNSSEKRDWFAGVLSELLQETPDADAAYVEEVLLQVMQDEFAVLPQDDSPAEIAALLLQRRARIINGDLTEVDAQLASWEERRRKGAPEVVAQRGGEADSDSDSDGEEEWDPQWDDQDVEMGDAEVGASAAAKTRREPEVDEDGFTKVVGKGRRR